MIKNECLFVHNLNISYQKFSNYCSNVFVFKFFEQSSWLFVLLWHFSHKMQVTNFKIDDWKDVKWQSRIFSAEIYQEKKDQRAVKVRVSRGWKNYPLRNSKRKKHQQKEQDRKRKDKCIDTRGTARKKDRKAPRETARRKRRRTHWHQQNSKKKDKSAAKTKIKTKRKIDARSTARKKDSKATKCFSHIFMTVILARLLFWVLFC